MKAWTYGGRSKGPYYRLHLTSFELEQIEEALWELYSAGGKREGTVKETLKKLREAKRKATKIRLESSSTKHRASFLPRDKQ